MLLEDTCRVSASVPQEMELQRPEGPSHLGPLLESPTGRSEEQIMASWFGLRTFTVLTPFWSQSSAATQPSRGLWSVTCTLPSSGIMPDQRGLGSLRSKRAAREPTGCGGWEGWV